MLPGVATIAAWPVLVQTDDRPESSQEAELEAAAMGASAMAVAAPAARTIGAMSLVIMVVVAFRLVLLAVIDSGGAGFVCLAVML